MLLNNYTIKYCALVMMVIDHVYQMFAPQGAPLWFYWIGRPVLPIFLFLCAEAFWHTSSRARYLLRLFVFFIVMKIACRALSVYLPVAGVELTNNVFETLFLAAFYMFCADLFQSGKIIRAILLMALPPAFALSPFAAQKVFFFAPNLLTAEGSFAAVAVGLLLYLSREWRIMQIMITAAASVLALLLLGANPQWLMIFAIIPMLLYNGKRGRGSKYFFYIFYPAHIFLLYAIAWFIQ